VTVPLKLSSGSVLLSTPHEQLRVTRLVGGMDSVRKLIDDDYIDDARVIDVNGVRLRVTVRVGSSARTPLLLANGIGASLETFEPLIEHLDPDPDGDPIRRSGHRRLADAAPAVPVAGVGAHAWTLA